MSYTNQCLYIDLSQGTIQKKESDQELFDQFIGGKGLGFALLEKLAPQIEAFSAENPIIFVNGPFTGTKIQTSARTALVTKSPLTNSMLDSHCGGNFGPMLKAAGFDYLVITGKSDRPVYLYLTDTNLEIRDADELWEKEFLKRPIC